MPKQNLIKKRRNSNLFVNCLPVTDQFMVLRTFGLHQSHPSGAHTIVHVWSVSLILPNAVLWKILKNSVLCDLNFHSFSFTITPDFVSLLSSTGCWEPEIRRTHPTSRKCCCEIWFTALSQGKEPFMCTDPLQCAPLVVCSRAAGAEGDCIFLKLNRMRFSFLQIKRGKRVIG